MPYSEMNDRKSMGPGFEINGYALIPHGGHTSEIMLPNQRTEGLQTVLYVLKKNTD